MFANILKLKSENYIMKPNLVVFSFIIEHRFQWLGHFTAVSYSYNILYVLTNTALYFLSDQLFSNISQMRGTS